MKKIFFLLTTLATVTAVTAQPPTAEAVLKEATMVAAKQNKNVFILFHASWCGWCHKMDTAMNDKAVKKYFDDNYVIRHLVVYESKDKLELENPGALKLLQQYKGADQGIPYWLIFDKSGKLLADSKRRPERGGLETGENTGCPASKEEVAHFVKVLKQTSSLKPQALSAIEKRFWKNAN